MEEIKKIILVLITAIILCNCHNNDDDKNDWTHDNLKAKVKCYKESSYKAKVYFGNIEKSTQGTINKFGIPIQVKYNKKGEKIEYNLYSLSGSIHKRNIYKYDNKGNRIEHINYNPDNSLNKKYISKYNGNKNKTELNKYNSEGALLIKHLFKYDDLGNNIERMIYSIDGTLFAKDFYKYDNLGNKKEETSYNSKGHIDWRVKYKYDDNGNQIEELFYYKSNVPSKETSKYNYRGNEIEKIRHNTDGSLESKYTFSYKYDKNGNWIKKIHFKNGVIPKYITEREYEYY